MNDREREQLTLITDHGLITRKKALNARVTRIFADHSAKGLLHSGATVKVAVRAMHEIADELLTDISTRAKSVVLDLDAFNLVSGAVNAFLDHCKTEELPKVTQMASGRLPNQPNQSITRAAAALYDDVRADIETKLAIIAFDFEKSSPPPADQPVAQSPIALSVPAKKGGRRPAEFWDDMWAHIATALFVGDLQPKSQADIERAMLEWIEANDYSAVESTVRARARRLWDRLAALD